MGKGEAAAAVPTVQFFSFSHFEEAPRDINYLLNPIQAAKAA